MNPLFEYRTTFAVIPNDFPDDHNDLAKHLASITPKPPKAEDWELKTTTSFLSEQNKVVVLYFWERPVDPRN